MHHFAMINRLAIISALLVMSAGCAGHHEATLDNGRVNDGRSGTLAHCSSFQRGSNTSPLADVRETVLHAEAVHATFEMKYQVVSTNVTTGEKRESGASGHGTLSLIESGRWLLLRMDQSAIPGSSQPHVFYDGTDIYLVSDDRSRVYRESAPEGLSHALDRALFPPHSSLRLGPGLSPVQTVASVLMRLGDDAFLEALSKMNRNADRQSVTFQGDVRLQPVSVDATDDRSYTYTLRMMNDPHPVPRTLIRRSTPDVLHDETTGDDHELQHEHVLTFTEWTFGDLARHEIDSFRSIFEQAESVESPVYLQFADGLPKLPSSDPQAMVGEPAPLFELEHVNGSPFALAEHVGEGVVILDFWTTWCVPCHRVTSVLVTLAEEFADLGVTLHAINVEESAEVVREFVSDRDWELSILLDEEGRVRDQYRAYAIPQVVIIDQDGIIQHVHVGFIEHLEKRLRDELQVVLDMRR